MTDREIMQQALDFLVGGDFAYPTKLATDLRERLAQPEQEPVAWIYRDSWGTMKLSQVTPPPVGAFPVYTAPPPCPTCEALARTVMLDQTSHDSQRKPLTDNELADLWYKQSTDWMEFARAIEAAHGIKGS